ncbi:MAG: hypothetical protein J6C10_05605 [Prevotella sp.]|nr:hypothetical protein [Prevotella sp.]
MKKILNITLIVMGCLIMASCNDDDYIEKTNSVYVTEGQTEIPAAGATKTITVAGEGIKAEADDEWLDVSVSGNVITVTANANYSRESRHTFVNITAANGDFLKVNVSQLGAVFVINAPANIVYDDSQHTLAYDFNTNLDVEVSTSDSWLKANLAGGKLTISTNENNSGHIRTGYVYYQAGTLADKIEVTQGDIDKDVVGKYYVLGGNDPDAEDLDDAEVSFLTAITKDGDQYNLVFPQFGWSMPVTFSKEDLTMTVSAGQSMGAYATYNVFSLIGDAAEGYITWNPSVTMTASIKQYTETDEDGTYSYVAGEFKDDGKWDGHASDVFSLGAFSSETPSNNGFVGTLAFFTDVAIIEYDMENMSAGKKAPKAISATKAKVMPMTLKNKYTVVK